MSLLPHERSEIVRRYAAGERIVDIAAAVECSEGTVLAIARAEGCERRIRPVSDRVQAAAREVLHLGCTQADAARRFRVSASQVSRAVKEMSA